MSDGRSIPNDFAVVVYNVEGLSRILTLLRDDIEGIHAQGTRCQEGSYVTSKGKREDPCKKELGLSRSDPRWVGHAEVLPTALCARGLRYCFEARLLL
ncbi:hypothetical protein V1477_015371 [Vespula maculifrons]|uniref:Uncharacterized protein n=2 Tax=Vespula TaxID=7451 RepID=A0A834JCU7_VESGE|nr:hypothetical protein HZH68_014361 [Vespula germanica]